MTTICNCCGQGIVSSPKKCGHPSQGKTDDDEKKAARRERARQHYIANKDAIMYKRKVRQVVKKHEEDTVRQLLSASIS